MIMIRCDGSGEVGMGHLLRCLSLASEIDRQGGRAAFAMGDSSESAVSAVRSKGFEAHLIPAERLGVSAAPLPTLQLSPEDAEYAAGLAARSGAKTILVDHYGADETYFSILRRAGLTVAAIDDIGDRDLSDVSWLLNQNLGAGELVYGLSKDSTVLLGPKYALLRDEFAAAATQAPAPDLSSGDRNVLMTFGGGDSADVVTWALRALGAMERPVNIRCILGTHKEPGQELRDLLRTSVHNIELFTSVDNMPEQMLWATLSINAGGSTCWELCCLGVPMVIAVTSRDQEMSASSLHKSGCAESLGLWHSGGTDVALPRIVEELLADPNRRAAMSSAARSLVDGRGAVRAAKSLLATA